MSEEGKKTEKKEEGKTTVRRPRRASVFLILRKLEGDNMYESVGQAKDFKGCQDVANKLQLTGSLLIVRRHVEIIGKTQLVFSIQK